MERVTFLFPNPQDFAASTPNPCDAPNGYTSPGFVVGIPAVPFIMPFLFGVVLLRRAGEEPSQKGAVAELESR
jgi:hypothetical protein